MNRIKRKAKPRRNPNPSAVELDPLEELRRLVCVEDGGLEAVANALDWLRVTISHYPPRGGPDQHYLNGIASVLGLAIGKVRGVKAALREMARSEE